MCPSGEAFLPAKQLAVGMAGAVECYCWALLMEAGHPLLPVMGEAHGASGSSLSPAAATILLSPQ